MLATITSKGQVTVPKNIRDQLNIQAGTQLDFTLNNDGTISVRPLNRTALSIVGILKRPGQKVGTIEQMNDAIAEAATERY
jgi:AbrB family looped-hinge helix DNA binding protein